ncbi:complement component C1q receptor isoform X2 [Danio rerio]
MMRVLIVMFSSFLIVGGTSRVSTTCTAEACLTLHLEKEHFEKASKNCIDNGGKLVTMRNDDELQSVKSAVLAAAAEGEKERVFSSKLWIGLSLQKRRCTDSTEELHGFRWTSEPEDSQYSYWKKKPLRTCTEKRCVSISLADDLRWTDGSCRDRAFYMCKFLSKGMCRPIVLEEQSEIKYNLPFLSEPLTLDERLVMIPHGTWAEVQCVGSEMPIISFCSNQDGPFDWTNSERFCAPEKRSCELKNGGCEQLCSVTAGGGVRCECREGYHLMDDKVSCAAKDNCENLPCEFKCLPTATGYSCACAEGFRLSGDNISCVDINECSEEICGDHWCQNTPGSYRCDCHPGFKLVAGKCEDVDECTELK